MTDQQSDVDCDAAPAGPYVHLVATSGGVTVRGQQHATFGDPAPDRDGVFATWQVEAGGLVVTNDRYGMCPLFYWAGPRQVAIARRIDDLLAVGTPAKLDHDALAVFVRLGGFVADHTCFAAIRALPPQAQLTWSAGRLRVESHRPAPAPARYDRQALIDGFVDRLRAAVGRRLPPEPYVLPLSGGRDSRHLLLELVRQGAPPRQCVSGEKFPPDDSGDAAIARMVAAAVGVPHTTLRRPASQLAAELVANRAQSMTTLEGGWTLPLLLFLRRHTRLTYDGIGGDLLTRRLLPRLTAGIPFVATDLAGTADQLLAAGRFDRYLTGLLGCQLAKTLSRQRAVAVLAAELRQHVTAPSPWTSFFFWNRTRRAIASTPFGLFADWPVVRAPFLDRDLFDFLMSVPDSAGLDPALHDEVIRRAYPRFAAIPWADSASGHGPRYLRHRLGYLTDLAAHLTTVRRDWWSREDQLFQRLLCRASTPRGLRTLNRTLPLAVYLNQLPTPVAGS